MPLEGQSYLTQTNSMDIQRRLLQQRIYDGIQNKSALSYRSILKLFALRCQSSLLEVNLQFYLASQPQQKQSLVVALIMIFIVLMLRTVNVPRLVLYLRKHRDNYTDDYVNMYTRPLQSDSSLDKDVLCREREASCLLVVTSILVYVPYVCLFMCV